MPSLSGNKLLASPLLLSLLLLTVLPAVVTAGIGGRTGGPDAACNNCMDPDPLWIKDNCLLVDDPKHAGKKISDPDCDTSAAPLVDSVTCEFNGDCICRKLNETCHSDFPAAYDALLAVLLVLWIHKCYECTLYLMDIRSTHNPKDKADKKPFTPIEKIVFLTSIANFIRLIWVICAFQGRNGSVFWGGFALDAIFLKVPQILWCGSFFYLTIVWNTIATQMITMKKANAADSAKAEKTANLINFFLVCIIIPLTFIGILALPFFGMIVNGVQIIIVLILIGGSLVVGRKLVVGLAGNESGKSIVGVIKFTIACGVGAAISLIVAVVYNLLFQSGSADTKPMAIWGFWVGVHVTGELLAVTGLLWTKHEQFFKKMKAAKVAASGNTTVTTHSAQSSVEK